MWVVNHGDDSLMKVSPSNGTVVAIYLTGNGPFAVVVGGGQVWVSNFASGSVSKTAAN